MRRWGVHHTETLENAPRAAKWTIRPFAYKIMDNLSIVNPFFIFLLIDTEQNVQNHSMNRLKELRIKKGVLQSDVAAYIGVNNSTYAYYERGTHNPTPETLCKLADFFGVTVDELLGRSPQLFDDARVDRPEVLDLFEQLSAAEQQQVIGYMKGLIYQHDEAKRRNLA